MINRHTNKMIATKKRNNPVTNMFYLGVPYKNKNEFDTVSYNILNEYILCYEKQSKSTDEICICF